MTKSDTARLSVIEEKLENNEKDHARIEKSNEEGHNRIESLVHSLVTKVDKVIERKADKDRVNSIEKKVNNIEVKQAGLIAKVGIVVGVIAAAVGAIINKLMN